MNKYKKDMINGLVTKHKEKKVVNTYYGVPMDNFTKKELLAIISELLENQVKQI